MSSLADPRAAGRFRLNLRLALLVGQSVAFGILLSLLIITGSALFLPTFGSSALAYVYIVVAILGSAVFYGFGELQRHISLTTLSVGTVGLIVIYLLLTWLSLTVASLAWIPFALMVSFSLIIQIGFVILGAQAGRLFDVRQVKVQFPRIVAGFVIGFLVGGFIAPRLGQLLGSTEGVMLGAAASAAIMLAFLMATVGTFRDSLQTATPVQAQTDKTRSKPLWQLLTKRYVLLVVAYQMLSAMASQLLDYAIFDQAAVRFTDSQSLAQFFGDYTVWLNLSDLIFLLALAGMLLGRYGLRLGLLANPLADGLFLVLEIGIGLILGLSSQAFFWLVAITRIIDITLTDGTTRSSINTTYQALPADERVAVQTAVEGIGVPLALGLTGVALLLFNAFSGINILHVLVFTMFITLLWGVAAVMSYRDYAAALTRTIRRRSIAPADLTLDDRSSMDAVLAMLRRDSLPEVILGLDMLEAGESDTLIEQLLRLAGEGKPEIQAEALARLEQRRVQEALPVAKRIVERARDGRTRGAALRTYSALVESDALDLVAPFLNDSDPDVRLGASVGLLHYGGIPGVLAVGERLSAMTNSSDPSERAFVAQVIGGVAVRSFYQPLQTLISDPNPQVRKVALEAARKVCHPRLLPYLLRTLDMDATRSTTICALSAYGEEVLPHIGGALSGEDEALSLHASRLARLCGQIKGEKAIDLLSRHINHSDSEVRYHVLQALNSCGFRASGAKKDAVVTQLEAECAFAGRLAIARQEIGDDEGFVPLQSALVSESRRTRSRVFLLLSFLYDSRATLQANYWLESSQGPTRAMALEMLDVNLASEHKSLVFPLISPVTFDEQAQALGKRFELKPLGRDREVLSIIEGRGFPAVDGWSRTCAVYAAGCLRMEETVQAVEESLRAPEAERRETAAWALYRISPARFRAHAKALARDPSPLVTRVTAHLLAANSRRT